MVKGLSWNACDLIFSDGEIVQPKGIPGLNADVEKSLHAYLNKFGKTHNVWWDQIDKKAFGLAQLSTKEEYEYSLLSSPGAFLQSKEKMTDCGGQWYVEKNLCPILGKEFCVTGEFMHHKVGYFNQFKGKDILILGGGPSTNEFDWSKINHDFIWSCNHFYLNPKIKKEMVSLFMVGNEVKLLTDGRLKAYMKNNIKSHMVIQPTDARKQKEIREIKKMYPKQSTYAHLRYRSRLGQMPRLIILASLLGARSVMFAGMDGVPRRGTAHAFEPGKIPRGAPTKKGAENVFRRQYVSLWDYVLNTLDVKTEFYNLGEGSSGNLTADISKQMFPLKRIYSNKQLYIS